MHTTDMHLERDGVNVWGNYFELLNKNNLFVT